MFVVMEVRLSVLEVTTRKPERLNRMQLDTLLTGDRNICNQSVGDIHNYRTDPAVAIQLITDKWHSTVRSHRKVC